MLTRPHVDELVVGYLLDYIHNRTYAAYLPLRRHGSLLSSMTRKPLSDMIILICQLQVIPARECILLTLVCTRGVSRGNIIVYYSSISSGIESETTSFTCRRFLKLPTSDNRGPGEVTTYSPAIELDPPSIDGTVLSVPELSESPE